VSSTVSDEREIVAAFPGPVARALLRLILPADRREEFEGDLIEEAETIVLSRDGRRVALCWFWWQVATSAPPMLARRWIKEVGMRPQPWIATAALLAVWGIFGLVELGNNPYGGFDWESSVVVGVDEGSPADRAGLREGDRILSMNGIPLDDRGTLRRQPRAEIGSGQVLVVERTDESTGMIATEEVEVTYAGMPAREWAFEIVGGVIGLAFLLSGMFVYLKAPSTPSLLFAIVGLGFAGMWLPGPYIGSFVLRAFAANIFFVAFLTAFAALLHLLLIFPRRKKVMERKGAWQLIYLPVVVFALSGIIHAVAELPDGSSTIVLYFLGILFLGYFLFSMAALIHSYVKAAPHERSEEGLNFLLAGVLIGLAPLTCMLVAGAFGVRTDVPGTDFVFLTLALLPVSFALALLRGAKGSLGQPATESA